MAPTRKFFPNNQSFDYEALRAATHCNHGAGDLGEIFAICSRIPSGNETAWQREWERAAQSAERRAKLSLDAGNQISAINYWLRASNYFRTAEFYCREDAFKDAKAVELSDQSWKSFVKAAEMMDHPFETVEIPYEGTTLPGYFIRAVKNSNSPGPTIICNGGFDSTKEETWLALGAAAVERGFNFLAFDGPGQGDALRKQRLFFRPDWEKVISPVMDYTLSRSDVRKDKVFIFGWSMGGWLVAKAATKEHRAAAIVLDDGVYDFGGAFRNVQPNIVQYLVQNKWDSTVEALLSPMMKLDTGAKWGLLNGKWTFGSASIPEFLRTVNNYSLGSDVEDIITPTLVMDAADDHFLLGQPQAIFEKLKCKKEIVVLDASDGSSLHCHQGAFGRCHQVIFDYLCSFLRY